MPFILHTPESLLPRSDSKNPATTCKGITSSGRPCRRALASSPRRFPSHSTRDGVLAVLPSEDGHEGAAAFFCFQHKDQAVSLTNGDGVGETTLHTLNERTSIDTLVDRLGFVDIKDDGSQKKRRHGRGKRQQPSRPVKRDTLPRKWQDVQGPLLALPQEGEKPSRRDARRQKRKPPSFLSMLCCMSSPHEDAYASLAPKPRPHTEKQTAASSPTTAKIPRHPHHSPSQRTPLSNKDPNRPSLPRDPPSQTQNLLSLIPKSLSPQTTSALLSELAKPVSEHDEEGYIYIFWLTPNNTPSPDTTAISSLLTDPSKAGPRGRKASDIPAGNGGDGAKEKILLKIGRASNVQRRMNEWTRQCGYALTLVRYYPYIPTSTSPAPSPLPSPSSKPHRPPPTASPNSPSPRSPIRQHPLSPGPSPAQPVVRKVPHAHKIERLIHLELGDRRVRPGCKACGREHREWFEVEGSREGVRSVDEVVRRWVGWGERG